MRTTEILDLLRKHPGSYIEHDAGTYWIKNKAGDLLTNFQPVHEQVADLLKEYRIREDRAGRYLVA